MSTGFRRILALQAAVVGLTLWGALASASDVNFWTLSISTGTAYNVPLNLRIEQENQAPLTMIAHYATRPFRGAPYNSIRLAWGSRLGAWEAELIHHKLYLESTTPEVPDLEATHGYNYVLVNRSFRRGPFVPRIGAGVAILHLEGTVRGQPIRVRRGLLGTSYRLAAPSAQLGVGMPIYLGDRVLVLPEVKLTGAHARVPIEGGRVTIPNIALHGVVGIGYTTRSGDTAR